MPSKLEPRVLIVEDEPDMNNLLAEVLSAYGFGSIQAGDAEQALAALDRETPDAILLDLMLPGMSGLELCNLLKTSRSKRTIPIIILTALDRPVDQRHGFETGADDYMTKPFTPEGLVARLQACLDQCLDARQSCGNLQRTIDLGVALADLKVINTLATCLYCFTEFTPREIETLRSGLMGLSDEASQWSATRRGASPVKMSVDLNKERLQVRFRPAAGAEAAAFVAEHLDPEAAVPSSFTDAGLIDQMRSEEGELVMEKVLPPQGAAS